MLKLLLRSLLILIAFGIFISAIEPIVFYFTSKPVEVKVLGVTKSIHHNSGYGGRGGKSYTEFNVVFERLGFNSDKSISYNCFSSIGNTDEWLIQDYKYEYIKNALNEVVLARESILDNSVCLYADVSFLKLSIYLFGAISLFVLALSYPQKVRRSHRMKMF